MAGKVVEGKKKEKRGRPSLLDVRKRTLKGKQQQKRNHKSTPHSASNYTTVTVPIRALGSTPLRRSPRLNLDPDTDESDFFSSDSDESDADEPRGRSGSMTDAERVRYGEQFWKSDVSRMNSISLLRLCLCLQL
jgi:hypothetical protein